MKWLFLLLFILIFMHFPAFSYASFPILSDTTQIQKETLEEYQIRIKKQGVLTKKIVIMRIVKLLRNGNLNLYFKNYY